jgi:spore coat polysaccharide biosynthesis protein SpsF (cytidylyltransferase family)
MIIVLQGRLRSTRLQGKGFFTFFGKTVWERLCAIALEVRGVEEVVFATGDLPENELMRPLVEATGARFLVGSESNVLERYSLAVRDSRADYVVRMTCDNYLIQPEFIEALAAAVRQAGSDYGYIEPLSHYAGEVIRREVLLEEFARGNYSPLAREHVTYDIRESAKRAKTVLPADFGGVDHRRSITLDTVDDLIQLKRLEQAHPALAQLRCVEELRKISPALR